MAKVIDVREEGSRDDQDITRIVFGTDDETISVDLSEGGAIDFSEKDHRTLFQVYHHDIPNLIKALQVVQEMLDGEDDCNF